MSATQNQPASDTNAQLQKLPDKAKVEVKENLKVEIKETLKVETKDFKQEKIEKNEAKEHKDTKNEKLEKNEAKEHKDAKNEKLEKNELKEHKDAKHEKVEKIEIKELGKEVAKIEQAEKQLVKEKEGKELVDGPVTNPGDPVEQRVSALEQSVANMQHFITSAQRPDLSQGALSREANKPTG